MQRLCVFCGSSPGHDPLYVACARDVGHVLAALGIGLVYGGGGRGMMGAVGACRSETLPKDAEVK